MLGRKCTAVVHKWDRDNLTTALFGKRNIDIRHIVTWEQDYDRLIHATRLPSVDIERIKRWTRVTIKCCAYTFIEVSYFRDSKELL